MVEKAKNSKIYGMKPFFEVKRFPMLLADV